MAAVIGNLAAMALLLLTPLVVLVERSFSLGHGHGLASWRALAGHHATSSAGRRRPVMQRAWRRLR